MLRIGAMNMALHGVEAERGYEIASLPARFTERSNELPALVRSMPSIRSGSSTSSARPRLLRLRHARQKLMPRDPAAVPS
jgi:hypothetical protein